MFIPPALYRRASSKEGLYFSLNNHTENDNKNCNNIERSTKKDLLSAAINDLQRALEFLHREERQQQQQQLESSSSENNIYNSTKNEITSSTIRQCQKNLDRLEKEYIGKWKHEQNTNENVSLSPTERNTNTDTNSYPIHTTTPQQEPQVDHSINNFNGLSQPQQQQQQQLHFATASKSQQKQSVLRLLLARQQNLSQQQHKALTGEAMYLLEWNWWVKWCRYVDFFYTRNDTTTASSVSASNIHSSERTQRVLDYLPPDATVSLNYRKDRDDDMSDDDDSDDDDDIIVESPGEIDNTDLLVTSNNAFPNQWFQPIPVDSNIDVVSLKTNLIRGYHYEILPREVYNALRSWYGERSPSLCRRVTKDYNIFLYPPPTSNGKDIHHNSTTVQLPGGESSRCNACRAPGASSRCSQCMSVQYCDKNCQESHWFFHRTHCKSQRVKITAEGNTEQSVLHISLPPDSNGRVGLNNLGNTCFMNSALQSLQKCTPLTRYFLSNRFKSDLNTSNPLGTGGKLASAYEVFLKDVWMKSGMNKSISPVALKRSIALFAPRFAGCHQHDAQEFLAYLLDGLHEDLNRIRRAPYVEMPDVTDGQNMAIAAARAWDAHKRRNDSLVLDTFYGQFQSTCVCPRCNRVSMSFDTFNHVSLEIPPNNLAWSMVTIPVLVHFYDGTRKPVRYGINLRNQSTISELKLAVSKLAQIPVTKLVLTDVYENSIHKLLEDNKHISIIRPNEDFIVAYEVTPYTVTNTVHIIVSQSLQMRISSSNSANEGGNSTSNDATMNDGSIENGDSLKRIPIGLPFMTSMDANNGSCHDIWQLIWNNVRRMVEGTEDGTGVVEIEGVEGACDDAAHHCRLEEALTIHVVDPKGRPRHVFQTEEDDRKTSVIPKKSKILLSDVLGEDCAESFLFLNLVWTSPTVCNKKEGIVINPNRFLECDDHPSFIESIRQQKKSSSTKEGVTLHQCFQSFSKPERLDVNNMWYCSKCSEHVQALKTMKLWKLPNILVVHLKRFEFKHALRRDKLGTFVDFPLTGLNMDPHCAGRKSDEGNNGFVDNNIPADYDLFAVVNHYGRMGFGHYTAFAMENDDDYNDYGKWNVFDDSIVSPIPSNEIPSSAAYILFYQRRVLI